MTNLPIEARVNLQFSDVSYRISKGRKKEYKSILRDVSGSFHSGQISAILGPSGAGKTSLLNILSGFITNDASGYILVNGKQRCLKTFRKQSCYIMQNDHLLQYLTVQESMQAAASLKLDNNLSKFEKNTVIQEILSNLNLEEIQKTRVANISGGEMKRLCIALELVNNPPVMFFDEPTSGLDSLNSYHCINLLKDLAAGGRTIICSIHQPSARLFESFDYLLALAEGHCIYRGSIPKLLPFMSSLALQCPSYHNPADFLIEVASGQYGTFINKMARAIESNTDVEAFSKKIESQALKLDIESNNAIICTKRTPINECDDLCEATKLNIKKCEKIPLRRNGNYVQKTVNFWIQFRVLFVRNFRSILRDPMFALLQLLAHLAMGICAGLLFFNTGNEANLIQSNVGNIVTSLMFLNLASMVITLLTFPLEMKIYVREYFNNWYGLKAFYCAKLLMDIPFQFILTTLFTCILYFMTNQPLEASRFFQMYSIFILTSLIGQSIGLTIGVALDAQKAIYVGASVLIPNVLYSGFFATFSGIPVYLRWLTYVSYFRYEYEGCMRATYGNGREQLHCSDAFCMFKYPNKILELFEIEDKGIWIDFLALFIYFVILRLIGYFIFRWKVRKER